MLPQPTIGGKLDTRVEKGRYMGVGMAGMLFLPHVGMSVVERRDVKEFETLSPLCGELMAPVDAVLQQSTWPEELTEAEVHGMVQLEQEEIRDGFSASSSHQQILIMTAAASRGCK
jgi:hypothetical protein